jgi:NAD/NADP transhydrogenase beta subunit
MRERARYVLIILAALFLLWNLARIVVQIHDRRGSIAGPVGMAIVMILVIFSQALSLRH